MPRLFQTILLLLMLMSATMLVAVRLIGGAGAISLLNTVMSTPDGSACDGPCLFGVLPGKTNAAEVVQLLQTHPLTHDARWIGDQTLQLTGRATYVSFSLTTEGKVDTISLTDNLYNSGLGVPGSLVNLMTLGELVAAFGVPNVLLPDSPYFVMNFLPTGITAASARPTNVAWRPTSVRWRAQSSTSLSLVMIYAFRPCPDAQSGGSADDPLYRVHRWLGFTMLERYNNDRQTFRVPHRLSGVAVPLFAPCQK